MLNEYKICPRCHYGSAYVASIYSSTSRPTFMREYVCHNCGYEFDEPVLPAQEKSAAEEIFDCQKMPAEPNWDALNRHMDNIIRESTRKLAKQVRQQAIDFIEKEKEAPTMQVIYNGFTGELVKLEQQRAGFANE